MKSTQEPIAVVLGDIDMLRPLALAGVPCAVCADKGALPRYSRYARELIEWSDPWRNSQALVDALLDFASKQNSKPVLFYESDADLLMISRNRERLSRGFRFVIPENDLTETLVDKLRFQRLAEQLQLPVPNAKLLIEDADYSFGKGDPNFPIVIKPLTRKKDEWSPIAGLAKAVRIDGPLELDEFKRAHPHCGRNFLAQEMIPGTESSIESYHVYVDSNGDIVGEFTGKKIRTFPKEFGQSCALTISAAGDVVETGREIVSKLGFRGVAKLDFKRDSDGKLFLLEINPRFNLWHHLGAVAGINLPYLVYCDLTGVQRPNVGVAKVGANWCRVWQDLFSARAEGVSFVKWLFWAMRCQAKPGISWDDPLPLLGAAISRTQHRLVQYAFGQKNARSQPV